MRFQYICYSNRSSTRTTDAKNVAPRTYAIYLLNPTKYTSSHYTHRTFVSRVLIKKKKNEIFSKSQCKQKVKLKWFGVGSTCHNVQM